MKKIFLLKNNFEKKKSGEKSKLKNNFKTKKILGKKIFGAKKILGKKMLTVSLTKENLSISPKEIIGVLYALYCSKKKYKCTKMVQLYSLSHPWCHTISI